MSGSEIRPLAYDPTNVILPNHGLSADALQSIASQLEAARDEALADLALWHSGDAVPEKKQPLDAGFMDLPDRLLAEYEADGEASEVGKIISTAKSLSEKVDRVVVLGIGGSYMGARALLESCCHPYRNDLSREDRNGWPKLYFEGNNVDNDCTNGLIEILSKGGPDETWGIVVISKSGGTLETATAFRHFLAALRKDLGDQQDRIKELVVAVTGETGKLRDLSNALELNSTFPIPDGVGGRFSILCAVGLLPAALMGLDIVALLKGASAMNKTMAEQPVGSNAVLDYVGISHLMESQKGCVTRLLSVWSKRLEAAGLWYDQLLAESLGKEEKGALPLTVVNTRDLHSRGQQHQEGPRDKVITNVIVEEYATPPLAIGTSEHDQDQLNAFSAKTLPEIMGAAIAGTNLFQNLTHESSAQIPQFNRSE
jgi:glucose-6-phosphate isomerase